VPPSVWGVWRAWQSPSSPSKFLTCDKQTWPLVDLRVTSNQLWKNFYSISIHWEFEAHWNQLRSLNAASLLIMFIIFDGKKMQNYFETFPRCHGNRKFTIEHAVTEAMVQ
jgi:hypothetical protein